MAEPTKPDDSALEKKVAELEERNRRIMHLVGHYVPDLAGKIGEELPWVVPSAGKKDGEIVYSYRPAGPPSGGSGEGEPSAPAAPSPQPASPSLVQSWGQQPGAPGRAQPKKPKSVGEMDDDERLALLAQMEGRA